MIFNTNNNRILYSCITTLTTIIRFSSHQRWLPAYSCTALSPRPTTYPVSNIIKDSNHGLMGFSSSTTTAMSASSTSSLPSSSQKRQRQRQSIHLNHAGASPSPQRVLDRVYTHLQLDQDNGGYTAQNAVQDSGDLNKFYNDIVNRFML